MPSAAAAECAFERADSPKAVAVRVAMRADEDAQAAGATPPLTLRWRDVTLERVVTPDVPRSAASAGTGAGADAGHVRILSGVSGFAVPGELLVVMGPSGAGKTSLLNVISGRATVGLSAEARVEANGRPWTAAAARQLAAYVVQEDLFYETLTVREHLLFQARLRDLQAQSPRSSRDRIDHSRADRVDCVLRDYGLYRVRDSLIGGARVRGISGGERKRLSIASEALGRAAVFFLDEPTSGLDSFTAAAVVAQLKRVARRGRKTVIATIHQPSSELVAQFDALYLLAAGRVVYHGPAADAVRYFAHQGFPCPAFLNPCDYFMTQLAATSPPSTDNDDDHEGESGGDGDGDGDRVDDDASARLAQLTQAWEAYRQTEPYASKLLAPSHSGADGSAALEALASARRPTAGAVARQVAALARRNVVRLARDRLGLRVAVMQSLLTAVLAGLVYLQLDMSQRGVQSFVGAFFFFTVTQVMLTANAQFMTVPAELALIKREFRAGLYHLAAWYAAKNASELPLQLALPTVFYLPVYFLVGIGHGAEVFFGHLALLVLLNSAAVGFGYMVSCLSGRPDITVVLGIAILMPMLLLGGLLVNTDDIPVYLVWIEYASPFKYGYEALMTVFWSRVDAIPCTTAEALACSVRSGEQVLRNYSMDGQSPWTSAAMLFVLNVAFRLLGLLALAVSVHREDN